MLKPIPDFDGYFADSNGDIYSNRNCKELTKLTPYVKLGYKRVRLQINGKCKDKSIAYLVARAYVEGYREGLEVNHKDYNRENNKPDNLEWLTRKENVRYSLSKPIKVITKSGFILYYSTVTDFCNEIGCSTSNFSRFYMKKNKGFINKFKLQVTYIEDIV